MVAQHEQEAAMHGTGGQQVETLVALILENLVAHKHLIRRVKPTAERVLQKLSPILGRIYAREAGPSCRP